MKSNKLKNMRRKLGLTQVAIAKKLQISQSAYSIAESNGIKEINTIKRYAVALNCDWKDLLDE